MSFGRTLFERATHQFAQFLEGRVGDPDLDVTPLPLPGDASVLFEFGYLTRQIALAKPRCRREFAHRQRPGHQGVENAQPACDCKGAEAPCNGL